MHLYIRAPLFAALYMNALVLVCFYADEGTAPAQALNHNNPSTFLTVVPFAIGWGLLYAYFALRLFRGKTGRMRRYLAGLVAAMVAYLVLAAVSPKSGPGPYGIIDLLVMLVVMAPAVALVVLLPGFKVPGARTVERAPSVAKDGLPS